LAVKINEGRGTQQEMSVSTKVSKEVVPFQQKKLYQKFPI